MKKFVLFLAFICGFAMQSQVQFEAKVSRATLGLNENLRVDFEMNADGDNFSPPNFEGFRVVGGPSQRVSQSWVNGRSSFNKAYSYFLEPKSKGTITIGSAIVEIQGQTYKTNPIKITVTNPVERQRQPGEPEPVNTDDALRLVAEVSKTNPYINEPITVVYKLYLSYNIGVNNWREVDKPKYPDFWSQNIDVKQLQAEQGTLNGQPMRYVVLRKTVLYPQKSGKLVIEPLSLDVDIQVPTGRRDFFGRQQIVEQSKKVSAGAKTIQVRALPEEGKPADFIGAVGTFDFKVTPTKTQLRNGESLDVTVSVSGTGNLKLFDLPKPVVPASLEVYDPVRKENVDTPLSGMNGKISDTYTIVPSYKGKYPIKPMQFSYFDLKSGRYKTITSDEIMVEVLDGPTANSQDDIAQQSPQKQEVLKSDQFAFVKLKTNLVDKNKKPFFGSTAFYILLALPFIAIPLLILARRKKEERNQDISGNKVRQSNKLVRKYLSEAQKQTSNKEQFYIALEKALHNFLKAKLQIETSEMSKEKIQELLISRQAQPTTVSEFLKLIESCEIARYAPASATAIQSDYEKAASLLPELEKQLK